MEPGKIFTIGYLYQVSPFVWK